MIVSHGTSIQTLGHARRVVELVKGPIARELAEDWREGGMEGGREGVRVVGRTQAS